MSEKDIFTVKDIASLLNIGENQVRNLIRLGKLKAKAFYARKDGYKITQEDFKEYCKVRGLNFEEIIKKYKYAVVEVVSSKPKITTNEHNGLYSSADIAQEFGMNVYTFYRVLEQIGFIFKENGKYKPITFCIRFGFVKQYIVGKHMIDYGDKYNDFLWTFIGKHFIEDQFVYEIGMKIGEDNKEIVEAILNW